MNDPIEQFRKAMAGAGLHAPDEILDDGKLHRFSPTGKNKDDAGWYVLHADGIPAGVFGDWRAGFQQTWCAKRDTDMTPGERQAMRNRIKEAQKQRDHEARERQAAAAERTSAMWKSGLPADGHPYLLTKQVKAYGLRVGDWTRLDRESGEIITIKNVLYVPMRDAAGTLHSLQGIEADGTKRFLFGGRVKGCYHSIGRPSGRLIIAEGYATGATVHEATGDAVAVAFNSGNLEPVARALRTKYPCLSIVIAADDDHMTRDQHTGELTNPGLNAAKHAAAAVGGLVAVPDFTGLPREDKHTDFNDVACLRGAVKIGGVA